MPKYRKKPVEIEAIQFLQNPACEAQIIDWAAEYNITILSEHNGADNSQLRIPTLEGDHIANGGDFIKGIQGEFYPCKPDIFEETYEAVE